jgi:hypothetical protein
MVALGRIENGVVVLEGGVPLPEGAVVSVVYPAAPIGQDQLSIPDGRQAMLDEFARLRSLPNENPGDDFDAAEHDRVLYGDAP